MTNHTGRNRILVKICDGIVYGVEADRPDEVDIVFVETGDYDLPPHTVELPSGGEYEFARVGATKADDDLEVAFAASNSAGKAPSGAMS